MRAHLKTLAAGASLAILLAFGVHAQSGGSLLVDVPEPSAPVALQPAAKPAASKVKSEASAASAAPASAPAASTAAPAAPAPPSAQIIPLPTDARGPDESALRYYASLQQTRRAETEIKRLKRLYPDWEPPENLFNTPAAGSVDEQPFWDLFALGKMEELRADIDRRMKKEPGWQPSADLIDKIRRKETRNSISALWKSGKWKDLVAFVKGNAEAVSDDTDVDILWTVAEAYAKTKNNADALNTYKSILKNNREPDQRLATVQKAMAVLRMSDVEELIAMARRDSSGRSEFDGISLDITRGRISAFLHDERPDPIPETEMKAFEEYARKDKDPNQPGLVAWYYYKTKIFSHALEWFKHAISQGGDAMIAHGLAHSLRELGMYRETEEVAYAWREPLVNNSILLIDILERDLTKEIPPYIEPERLLRYAQVTMDNASGEGAQGLAWYAYNSCQFTVAHEWFQRAVAWSPKEATVYGYALTLQKLKKTKEFWDTLNRYDGLFPKVIEIIYPDDRYHPPTPCDLVEGRGQQVRPNYTVPAPYAAGQPYAAAPFGAQSAATRGAVSFGGVPATPAPMQPPVPVAQTVLPQQIPGLPPNPYAMQPQTPGMPANPYAMQQQMGGAPVNPYAMQPHGQAGYYQNPDQAYRREPRIDRKLFPVSIDPQNPLRFYPTGRYMGAQAPAASQMIAPVSPLVSEPPMGMSQLVARRVPDVAQMPYERWGYALLPGYNGINGPSAPHDASRTPAGTLWTTLLARDAASTRGGAFDPLRQDIAALVQHMNRVPRVPPPDASIKGPWRAPPPYKSREQLEAEGMIAPANASAGPADVSQQPSMAPAIGAMPAHNQQVSAAQTVSPEAAILPPLATNPNEPRPAVPQSAMPTPEARVEYRGKDSLGRKATDLYNARRYVEALDTLDERLKMTPETTDLRLIRAWSLLNLNRVDDARRVFGTLSSTGQQPRAANAETNRRTR